MVTLETKNAIAKKTTGLLRYTFQVTSNAKQALPNGPLQCEGAKGKACGTTNRTHQALLAASA